MSENIIQECETRLNSLQRGIETATGESYNDLTEAVKGSIDRYNNKPWYDFVVELTSDIANGAELIEVLTPHLADIRYGKDMVFCTLLNADKKVDGTNPLLWGVFGKKSNNSIGGMVSRYRFTNALIGMVDATTGYGCVGLAGDKYYVKVVNILE